MTPVLEPNAGARREERQRRDAPAEIILLRHGEPDWAPDGISVEDAPLSERGRRQAEAAAAALGATPMDGLYVSPLRRAQETAAPLAAALGIEPVTLDGLAEIQLDSLAGRSQPDVDAYFTRASRRRLSAFWDGWPEGETFRGFHRRVTESIADILSRHDMPAEAEDEFTVWRVPAKRHRIGIVAHGGTNSVALTHLLDVPPVPWEWSRFESELAAYSVSYAHPIGMTGFTWALSRFNVVGHLEAEGLRG